MNDVEKAKQRIRDHQERLRQQRESEKPSINERMAEEGSHFIHSYDFWCDECLEDFTTEAERHVLRLYGDPMITYRAECPDCEEECVRLVTHRDADPYYYLSDKINMQRNEYFADMLQADDYGFRTLYGEPFEEYHRRLMRQEEMRIRERKGLGFKGML